MSDKSQDGENARDDPPHDVTLLLVKWRSGDDEALDELVSLVYNELRRLAGRYLNHENVGQTLQTHDLIHEAFLRLIGQRHVDGQNRAHFFGIAAQMMRRILVDHARTRNAKKRDARVLVSLSDALVAPDDPCSADVLAIDEALGRLARLDPDQERIVELRFFAGLTIEETAHVIGRSPRTVKREWQLAKAWLFRELHPERV
jgi:RNA polymerase sigma factor (TIGR02999 family)